MIDRSPVPFPELAFAKQFLISAKPINASIIDGWQSLFVSGSYTVYHHPQLSVEVSCGDNCRIVGIGVFLNADDPTATNADIIVGLAFQTRGFDDLERLSSRLSGRWVICAAIGGETRVYPDATAQKPVFYSRERHTVIASQPELLRELGIVKYDQATATQFKDGKNSGSWPIGALPYHDVRQLKPNHYLQLDHGTTHRFWPKGLLAHATRSEAAHEMCKLLQGAISAAVTRRECVLSLTGGYDSRLVLACAKKHWSDIDFFTVIRSDSAHHDISIPKALAKRFGLNHRFVPFEQTGTPGLLRRLGTNVGDMYSDPACQATYALHKVIGKRLHLTGLISEVNRCFYYEDGNTPKDLSHKQLAELAGFKGNAIAERGFRDWLANCPSDGPI